METLNRDVAHADMRVSRALPVCSHGSPLMVQMAGLRRSMEVAELQAREARERARALEGLSDSLTRTVDSAYAELLQGYRFVAEVSHSGIARWSADSDAPVCMHPTVSASLDSSNAPAGFDIPRPKGLKISGSQCPF